MDEKKPERIKLVFSFTEASLKKLDEIKDSCSAKDRADVIVKALKFFAKCVDAEISGVELIFRKKDGKSSKISAFLI